MAWYSATADTWAATNARWPIGSENLQSTGISLTLSGLWVLRLSNPVRGLARSFLPVALVPSPSPKLRLPKTIASRKRVFFTLRGSSDSELLSFHGFQKSASLLLPLLFTSSSRSFLVGRVSLLAAPSSFRSMRFQQNEPAATSFVPHVSAREVILMFHLRTKQEKRHLADFRGLFHFSSITSTFWRRPLFSAQSAQDLRLPLPSPSTGGSFGGLGFICKSVLPVEAAPCFAQLLVLSVFSSSFLCRAAEWRRNDQWTEGEACQEQKSTSRNEREKCTELAGTKKKWPLHQERCPL